MLQQIAGRWSYHVSTRYSEVHFPAVVHHHSFPLSMSFAICLVLSCCLSLCFRPPCSIIPFDFPFFLLFFSLHRS
ncbi:hypothetical protein BDW42DRAFT_179981 [Aspergillus taichungensis]|uniref:Uncharacterized protein n=1 Tax=Aspergillus taichungensis TaxID=482145 RepID=A0A2J5HFZ4_9EURO|nr:hypothetical protein BDW42DRAFT_179981 [Aspergillus taichungensis]